MTTNLPDLTTETLWAILNGEISDTQVNELVWFYLGYRQIGDNWDLTIVSDPWSDKYPVPPNFIENRPATVQLTRSIPKANKQLLKTHLGFQGYSINQLKPSLTRRATAVSWLLSYMQDQGMITAK